MRYTHTKFEFDLTRQSGLGVFTRFDLCWPLPKTMGFMYSSWGRYIPSLNLIKQDNKLIVFTRENISKISNFNKSSFSTQNELKKSPPKWIGSLYSSWEKHTNTHSSNVIWPGIADFVFTRFLNVWYLPTPFCLEENFLWSIVKSTSAHLQVILGWRLNQWMFIWTKFVETITICRTKTEGNCELLIFLNCNCLDVSRI